MIEIAKLSSADIGRWVEYISSSGEHQPGRIKGWNRQFVYVVYWCNDCWDQYERYTAAPTVPEDLRFSDEQQKSE